MAKAAMWVLPLLIGGLLQSALARKWRLPAREASALIVLSMGGVAIMALAAVRARPQAGWAALTAAMLSGQLALFIGGLLARFYRDPERSLPADPRTVLSPADGTVIYRRRLPPGAALQTEKKGAVMGLDELAATSLAREELWQIGISMVFSDVHVNRAPISGQVILLQRRAGSFLSLRRQEAASLNERQTILIAADNVQVALVQVASRLVRRIQAFVAPGDRVQRGQRIGIIKLGSQVDLFIPTAQCTDPDIALGQHLIAGESIICQLKRATGDWP